jgi:flagellin
VGFRINTNIASIQGQTSLNRVARESGESFAKLSSGERITKAADDAAGLAISEKMKSEIRSSKQANRNANDGISLIQTAEGALNESASMLTRMRELAMQSASDTIADSDRQKSDLEYQQLKSELERISQVTEFNGRKLLNGSGGSLDFQVGTGSNTADDHITYQGNKLNSGIHALGISELAITSKGGAQMSLGRLDSAIRQISGNRATMGSLQNRLVSGSNNLQIYTENMSSANSRIRDVDYAVEAANQAKNSIMQSAGTAVLSQANEMGKGAMKLLS